MSFIPAWRVFRRMQDSTCAAAALIYAGAALNAWRVLPGDVALKATRILAAPALMLTLCLFLPIAAPPLRRWLTHYVWMSFKAGFGQTAASVIIGLGLLAGAALFIYWQTAAVAYGGRYPAGVFSGYGAGIGILMAQAWLVRALERDPNVRAEIEETP